MKRIDLHIHTVKTECDPGNFSFDIDALKNYVTNANLDAIAVTNHNKFDLENLMQIEECLDIPVFPGVELNVSTPGSYGHVLVIAPRNDLDNFNSCMAGLSPLYPQATSHLKWDKIADCFQNINNYLIIPHYKKHRQIDSQTLATIKAHTGISALEVDNNKKWLRFKDSTQLPLVVFSDSRPGLRPTSAPEEDAGIRYAYGFTYLECEEMTVPSIKMALSVKRNVSIFKSENEFEVLPESVPASKRLNVVLGSRSSGKTHTLERILDAYAPSDCVYIRQFDITRDAQKDAFNKIIEESDESFFDDYFLSLQLSMVNYFNLDYSTSKAAVGDYCEDLVTYANSPEDDYSNCPIYSAQEFSFERETQRMKADFDLVKAIRTLSSSTERKDVIAKYISDESFTMLEQAINDQIKAGFVVMKYKDFANSICKKIKEELRKNAARQPLPSLEPLKTLFKDTYFENELSSVIGSLQVEKPLDDDDLGKFRKTRTRRAKTTPDEARAGRHRSAIPTGTDIRGLFGVGTTPVDQLRKIASYGEVIYPHACRLLFKINTSIVNNDATHTDLSGGQRAEYIFLDKLFKAESSDIVLIDEPESSFDNGFLNKDVLDMLNKLADKTTVFLVTHNNTLGVSIAPDRVLYTKKCSDGAYRVYSGLPSSQDLCSCDGETVNTASTLLNTMEAGLDAYNGRKAYYAIVED